MESAENPPPLVGNEREKQSNPNAEEEKRKPFSVLDFVLKFKAHSYV